MADPKNINILLLGESGVGKSTFINACHNYFVHPTLDHALEAILEVIIPAKFEITDKYFNHKIVQLGNLADCNECFDDAVAATQNVKVYNYLVEIDGKKYRLRLIDTPGIGDPRGLDQDKLNCERILNFISDLNEIHGFCMLLKPNCPRLDIFLTYCLTQLLARLESSAVDNMFFVFSNSRGENFTPGKTLTTLKALVQKLKNDNNITVPLTRENIFCFDNEGFRFVGAAQNGVQMDDFVYGATKLSWERSSKELWRMIEYVVKIKPHDLQKTMLINESKTVAILLSKPLWKILEVIQGNLGDIENTTNELNKAKLTFEELDIKMRKPHTELIITETQERQTVCCHRDCIGWHKVNGILEVYHKNHFYPNYNGPLNMCPIFQTENSALEVVKTVADFIPKPGVKAVVSFLCLLSSWFIGKPCRLCGHDIGFHEQVFYKTELVTKDIDDSLLPKIDNQKDLIEAKEKFLKKLQKEKTEYEYERQLILETCAILKRFLKANTIAPVGDLTEEYLNYQMICGSHEAKEQIQKILIEYDKIKNKLEKIVGVENEPITCQKINAMKRKLFFMKHFGSTIEKMFILKDIELKKDIKNMEVQVMDEYVKKPFN